jgi:uncharacterized membrane protein
MAENEVQVFVAVFDDESEANETLKDFQAMQRAGSIDLVDAAVIVRDMDGKVKFKETADPGAKTWGKRGAVVGGVVGLIFPPSLIASAGVGAGAGAIWGKFRDKGIENDDLKALGESMDPGTSAVIAVAQDKVLDQLEAGLEGYQRVARHAVGADAAFVLTDELGDEAMKPASEQQQMAGSTQPTSKDA